MDFILRGVYRELEILKTSTLIHHNLSNFGLRENTVFDRDSVENESI